jgi:hypothetical protein
MNRREECLLGLDVLWSRYLTVRAAFPYFRASDIGQHEKRSARFYRARGKDLTLKFPTAITEEDVVELNDAGYWVNQSFVIGAWALLEYHGFVSPLENNSPGFDHVNILRRLRKVFAHTNGRYNPSSSEERRLFESMVELYRIGSVDDERFNLQVDEVLHPMLDGVRSYVKASPA